MKYFYVYILLSERDGNFYTGFSNDLNRRIKEHNEGKVRRTKNRLPLNLVYWEGCLSKKDDTDREKYLKTTWGKRYIKNRIKDYLTG
jgi:putative endonuclease